jgi:hypothetical protein
MVRGGCLCGKIRYKYTGDITEVAMCHCSQCRKAQGGAFATNSPVDATKLILTGQEFIKKYESNENKVRAFCQNCGSPLYSARKDLPNIMRLRVGTIDTSFTCENKYHIFSFSKATWLPITDNYPQFEEHKEP